MKSRIDLIIEKLIKSKYRTLENARKDRKISDLLSGSNDLCLLPKREKAKLLSLLLG
jgi:hypothetical protein